MKRFHKFSVVAVLSAVLLFVPLQGNNGVRAQGLPTIDLSNLATAIMNWLQDQDVAGLFETVSGKAIAVEEWAEKIAQVNTYIQYAHNAIEMYNAGIGIYNCLMDIYRQADFIASSAQYFWKLNAPTTIIATAAFLSADFTELLKETVKEVSETITRYTTMGIGNALNALRMSEEVVLEIRNKMFQAVSYYRLRMSELLSYYKSIERAASNAAFINVLFY